MVSLFNIYQQPGLVLFSLLVIVAWTLVWKGLGLWFSAKNEQKAWFICILIFNTLGLLPIIYLLWFRQMKAAAKKPAGKDAAKKSKNSFPNPRKSRRKSKK